jgi:peptide subunit release factor 1 (eRF1)
MRGETLMPDTDPAQSLSRLVERLARFEPGAFPVLSLYLDTRPDQHGRDAFSAFLRKELADRGRSFARGSEELAAYERDAERIRGWLASELSSSANGAALFACGPAGLFEAAQLRTSVGPSRLVVARAPQLFPLVQLIEQNPRYAALVADTNLARLFVFGLGERLREEQVESPKTSRSQQGGWSQMRYQRHIDDQYQKHAREVVAALERVVRQEAVDRVLLAGDEVILPRLRQELSPEVEAKVVDTLALDIRVPEHELLERTLELLRRHDERTDAEAAAALLDEFRAGGLATVGALATHAALSAGQAHELVLNADPGTLRVLEEGEPLEAATDPGTPPSEVRARGPELAEELVTLARQTGAEVKLLEDARLLEPVGGVAAWLRYRMDRAAGEIEGRTR